VNTIGHSDAAIETHEIRATAEEHVLAVVDDLIDAWVTVRACAPAKVAAAFDEFDVQAGLGEGTRGTHAGHTTANYDCRLFAVRLQRVHNSDGSRNASPIIADGTSIRRLTGPELIDVLRTSTYDVRNRLANRREFDGRVHEMWPAAQRGLKILRSVRGSSQILSQVRPGA
jgi:hypothetical protein